MIDAIQAEVAQMFGVSLAEMRGPSTQDRFARPRLVAFRRLRDEAGLNFKQIGDIFNRGRDTVSRGYRAAAAYCANGGNYRTHFRDGRPRYELRDCGHETLCWHWLGHVKDDGYGWWRHERKIMLAHRVMHMLSTGPIAAGLEIDHLCRHRACVNPAHLEAVTPLENTRRRDAHKRATKAESTL